MKKLIVLAVVAAVAALSSLTVQAADKKDAPAEKKAPAARGLPGKGKITAIDKSANTIKVGEKVYALSATTKINKGGKAATLDDAAVGDEVGLYYRETDSGKLELISLRVGPLPERKAPAKDEKKEK